ncbi:MAG: hypothetical protein CL389_06230 [Acidiferrobacteraceae bacterium]|jgi:hypothetical protein|nr:hypothetical protein [Acidiferrobacteraceae bacterium]MDP6397835.1 C25 family cysteine peptidase [Arenicellales bacterium]|tara:strand:+ start:6145 stop:7776 length:1632 start_codon:yes stop_codon:yes gene_type:complete
MINKFSILLLSAVLMAPPVLADLPTLASDDRGFVLSGLSPKAIQIRAESRKATVLRLVGRDDQNYADYLKLQEVRYGTGRFIKRNIYTTPALKRALWRPAKKNLKVSADFRLAKDRVILKYKLLDPRIAHLLKGKNGLIDIFVPSELYDSRKSYKVAIEKNDGTSKLIEKFISLRQAINRYKRDLEANGYWVKIYKIDGGDHTDIKDTLVQDEKYGLIGGVMMGSVPVAWYRNEDDYNGNPAEFPMDFYYMDLDGTWGDADNNGVLDSHEGDVAPEIWIGRISGSLPKTEKTEAQLIVEYLSRNHYFRTQNKLKFPQRLFKWSGGEPSYRSLAYHDDDYAWAGYSRYLDGYLTDTRLLNNDPLLTNEEDYLETIDTIPGGYWYSHLMAHSSPTSHSFDMEDAPGGSVNVTELNDNRKRAHFYNLFNCSGAKFTTDNYFAGLYTFGNKYGLGAVGSTKTGSMLEFDVYYANLSGSLMPEHSDLASDWDVVVGEKQTFGTAFLKWFRYLAKDGFDTDEIWWHYGMVYLGDPTLYPDWNLNNGYER